MPLPGTRRMPTRRPASGGGASPMPDTSSGSGNVTMPKTNRDPVWSLCPWPIEVIRPGLELRIEALPAVHWLQFLLHPTEPDFTSLIAELLPELEEYYLGNDEAPDLDGLRETVLEIVGVAGARPWWQVLRLTMMAASNWDILGPRLIMNGANATQVSLAAWLDVLILTVLENIEPSKATMFTLQLEAVPTELADSDEEDGGFPAMDESAFLSMASN